MNSSIRNEPLRMLTAAHGITSLYTFEHLLSVKLNFVKNLVSHAYKLKDTYENYTSFKTYYLFYTTISLPII
ncbi:hypothetical protein N7454_007872 [Penicillium verhagenii]|nr:hypothetical protein N7454_007872 [Penicillium verhagenii]